MIIFSALAGFFVILLMNALGTDSAENKIKNAIKSSSMLWLYVVGATAIIFCTLVFHAGATRLLAGVPYGLGEFLSMPIIGMSIIAFITGAWIGVEKAAISDFLKRLVSSPKE